MTARGCVVRDATDADWGRVYECFAAIVAEGGTYAYPEDPGVRGRGVGRALGDEVVAWATREGYRGIQFNAVVETDVVALGLWRDLGFEVVGTVPGAFDHRVHGDVGLHVMYRAL